MRTVGYWLLALALAIGRWRSLEEERQMLPTM